MALTRTRTRTQTALTRLATMVAEVHGELEFVEGLLARAEAGEAVLSDEQAKALRSKKEALEEKRQALYLTLRQFEPDTNPESICSSQDWLKPWGRDFSETSLTRYCASLEASAPANQPKNE